MALTSTMAPSVAPPPTSAAGLLALLSEDDILLKKAALQKLLPIVDTLWHEVAEYLPDLEALAEDLSLDSSTRQTAAAVASRVFFHLAEPNQALRLALEGGGSNDVWKEPSAYVECLIRAALDVYIQKQKLANNEQLEEELDEEELNAIDSEKLQKVVQRLLEQCYRDQQYTHALGIAMEARQIPQIEEILSKCPPPPANQLCPTLQYCLITAIQMLSTKHFRNQVLQVIADQLEKLNLIDHIHTATTLTLCYQLLKKPAKVAEILTTLLDSSSENSLLAYQICFDLVDSGDQHFVFQVSSAIVEKPEPPPADNNEVSNDTSSNSNSSRTDEIWDRFSKSKRVLIGGFSSELSLSFLHKQSDSDPRLMPQVKKSLEERGGSRNSVLHHCAIITHAYLNAGTTNDSFLRDHLDWMRKASNWAKFSATASLGVLHAGHTTEAMTLLEPYLPPFPDNDQDHTVSPTGGYSEGGSLYALGLIHGSHAGSSHNKRKETCDFLRRHLRVSHTNEVISHGAALGVGLTAFGTGDVEIVAELKELMETDSAVAGEAAGMAIGLVLMGTGIGNTTNHSHENEELTQILSELKDYARDTKHEKNYSRDCHLSCFDSIRTRRTS